MLKAITKRPLSKNILAILSVTLFTVSSIGLYRSITLHYLAGRQVLGANNHKESAGLPMTLTIPTLNIKTGIQSLGVTSDGEMDVPSNASDVGWYMSGSRPGENGSAVIAGHLDKENGDDGVFANLSKLKTGDRLFVEDNNNQAFTFAVRESRLYDPGYANEVFIPNDSPHLNLVTCSGVWDKNKKSYSKRLVVFTDRVY